MFASSLFMYKGYEATLLRLDSPIFVEAFCLPKYNNKIFFLFPYLFLSKLGGSSSGFNIGQPYRGY
jgi:hypothetical protein